MSFVADCGSNNSGYYELQAVLTHKGRSSSSGHYVAWVRSNKQGLLLTFHRCLFCRRFTVHPVWIDNAVAQVRK